MPTAHGMHAHRGSPERWGLAGAAGRSRCRGTGAVPAWAWAEGMGRVRPWAILDSQDRVSGRRLRKRLWGGPRLGAECVLRCSSACGVGGARHEPMPHPHWQSNGGRDGCPGCWTGCRPAGHTHDGCVRSRGEHSCAAGRGCGTHAGCRICGLPPRTLPFSGSLAPLPQQGRQSLPPPPPQLSLSRLASALAFARQHRTCENGEPSAAGPTARRLRLCVCLQQQDGGAGQPPSLCWRAAAAARGQLDVGGRG